VYYDSKRKWSLGSRKWLLAPEDVFERHGNGRRESSPTPTPPSSSAAVAAEDSIGNMCTCGVPVAMRRTSNALMVRPRLYRVRLKKETVINDCCFSLHLLTKERTINYPALRPYLERPNAYPRVTKGWETTVWFSQMATESTISSCAIPRVLWRGMLHKQNVWSA